MRPRNVALALAFVAFLVPAASVHAQLFRAYLSVNGSDVNTCTVQAPCRLLPAALAAVASGGEIWMLDSANFNTSTVSITKSVSILAVPGAVGSVVANGAPAISIATPGLSVSLRNIVATRLAGSAGTVSGIAMSAASTLVIENSLVKDMTNNGVDVSAGSVKISNSVLRNNLVAVSVRDAAGVISGSQIVIPNTLDAVGVSVFSGIDNGTAAVTIADSLITGPSAAATSVTGVLAEGSGTIATAFAKANISRCTIEQTGNAVVAFGISPGAANVILAANTIANNFSAWGVGINASIQSVGNNNIIDFSTTTGALGLLTTQ